jgi:hypothetical protein
MKILQVTCTATLALMASMFCAQGLPAAAAPPDLTGVWTTADGAGNRTSFGSAIPKLPLHPQTQQRFDAWNRLVAETGDTPRRSVPRRWHAGRDARRGVGIPSRSSSGQSRSPSFTNCTAKPGGCTSVSATRLNRIACRGRTGYSAGRWEGDVLVVETNNLVEQLDQRTTPHSEEARIVERYRLDGVDAQGRRLLAAEVTMTDPKFYTEAVKFTRRWAQVPNGHLLPYECNEEVWRDRIDMLAEKKGAKVP